MKTAEFLETFDGCRGDAAVLASSGVSGALWRHGHRSRTIYNMGMSYTAAASLGLALNRPDLRVVAIEGDGSFLMGLPTLATTGRYRPANLCIVVFDNRTYLCTGTSGELVSAAGTADLAGLARGAGINEVHECDRAEDFAPALEAALAAKAPAVVVAEVDLERESWILEGSRSRLSRAEVASEFRRSIAAAEDVRAARPGPWDPRQEPEWAEARKGWRAGAVIYEAIREAGVDFLVYLPASMLYPIMVMAERDPGMTAICCTREDEGVAIASGAEFAGRTAALVSEGTGIGMAATALAGLVARRNPLLVVSSHPASLGVRHHWDDVSAQVNEPVLDALHLPVARLSSPAEASTVMRESVRGSLVTEKPWAVVLPPYVMD